MAEYRFLRAEALDGDWFPLTDVEVCIEVKSSYRDAGVPEAAKRRLALQAIQRVVTEMDLADLQPIAQGSGSEVKSIETEGITVSRPNGNGHSVQFLSRHESVVEAGPWVQPVGVDLRVAKTAHRVIQELTHRKGAAVLASDLVRDGVLSAPSMTRLLNPREPLGEYVAPYLHATPHGRTRSLQLTPKGHRIAQLIKEGEAPV